MRALTRGVQLLLVGSLLTFAWLGGATPVSAAEIRGRVELHEPRSKAGAGAAEMASTVVFFQPETGARVEPSAKAVEMVTEDKRFAPRVVAVTAGTTVRFPNRDPILHNVFSVSPGNAFDLGFYRQGDGKEWRFERPGLVRVYCNVHYEMVGYVLVLDTPYFVFPDPDGSFVLDDLPSGTGRLTVWHERARPWSRRVSVPNAAALHISLTLDRPRVPKHQDKSGKPYTGGSRGRRYR